ncbi:hypothetical protein [Sagittula sp. S175]|uniref:hypothetical protein n=1 Tax=Sagittula sp. S175 TaxID=3415129 RepID=UPI003C7DA246
MDALIDLLLDWIGDNSAYRTSNLPHPDVIELSPQQLTREFYSGVAHLMPDSGIDERLNALYAAGDGPHGTVYILAPKAVADAGHFEDPHDNPLWREILLHELVHHVQHMSGAVEGYACVAMGEAEAYGLGGIYLRQRHVTDPLPNRNFWAAIYARC